MPQWHIGGNKNPLHGAHRGGNHHPTGLIFSNNKWHTSEHGMGGAPQKKITSQITTNSLRAGTLFFGEERLGFSQKEVGTHSIWSWFAMKLYLDKFYPETIMIMGRWASRAFLRYIHIQVSDLSKGISTLMTNNHAFYTIPEIEVFYHTPGQLDTDPQMLRLNKQRWEHTTSSLSLLR